MKTITEQELANLGRIPRKTRISLRDGTKQVHIFSDAEIVEFVKTGKVNLDENAEWLTVVREKHDDTNNQP